MSAEERVVIDEHILSGKPVIRGTRVPVQVIIGALAGGMSREEICREYRITEADVQAALAYAAQALAEEKVHAIPHR